METNHQPQQQQQKYDLGNKNNNSSSSSSYLCRQSTSRWTPTSDQIRILKELYYNNGIRSPTADQIQRIAARLRHYGKIEGKNVFYWFQNHKARERQKKRFIPPQPQPQPQPQTSPPAATITTSPFSDQLHMHSMQSHHIGLPHFYRPPEASFIPVSCSSGSLSIDKSFMECSISAVESNIQNLGSWVNEDETTGEEDEGTTSAQIETLPLFPIHSHDGIFNTESSSEYNNRVYFTGGNWFRSDSRTSLELSLNSYGHGYYN